jgi:hypothetical protein
MSKVVLDVGGRVHHRAGRRGAVITGRRTFDCAGHSAGDRRLFDDPPPDHVELDLLRRR